MFYITELHYRCKCTASSFFMYIVNECFYVMYGMQTELDVPDVIFVTGWTEWTNDE